MDTTPFDMDAACRAALQRINNHIEDRYTVARRRTAFEFADAKDRMRSRFKHLGALTNKRTRRN